MSQNHTGNVQPSIDSEEHDHLAGKVAVKKVGNYKWNGSDWERWDGSSTLPTGAATETTLLKTVGLGLPEFDYCSQVQAATTDTWTFKTGGVAGTTVATVTITYTGTDKGTISSVART